MGNVKNKEVYRCSLCEQERTRDLFYFRKSGYVSGWCKVCRKEYYSSRYKKVDKEKHKEKCREYYNKNLDKQRTYYRDYYKKRREEGYVQHRTKRVRKATPKWLSGSQKAHIRRTYKLRDVIAEATGVEYHVDHIVPINGEGVCGLHVPWNLSVITAEANFKKGNKLVETS